MGDGKKPKGQIVNLELLVMDKRIAPIALVAYFLMIVTYTLGFVEKYNTITGLMIFISTIVFVLLIIRYFSNKKDVKREESPTSNQEIGTMVTTENKLTYKNIRQSGSGKQDIGGGSKAREMLFEKIQQNNK